MSELVAGFESPFGMELLSTVHWVVHEENARTFDEVEKRTYAWNDRKKRFSPRQLRIALDVLSEQGWISNVP